MPFKKTKFLFFVFKFPLESYKILRYGYERCFFLWFHVVFSLQLLTYKLEIIWVSIVIKVSFINIYIFINFNFERESSAILVVYPFRGLSEVNLIRSVFLLVEGLSFGNMDRSRTRLNIKFYWKMVIVLYQHLGLYEPET